MRKKINRFPAYIVIDGNLIKVTSWSPDAMAFNCTKISDSSQWRWHISEVNKVLDIDREVIEEHELGV